MKKLVTLLITCYSLTILGQTFTNPYLPANSPTITVKKYDNTNTTTTLGTIQANYINSLSVQTVDNIGVKSPTGTIEYNSINNTVNYYDNSTGFKQLKSTYSTDIYNNVVSKPTNPLNMDITTYKKNNSGDVDIYKYNKLGFEEKVGTTKTNLDGSTTIYKYNNQGFTEPVLKLKKNYE